MIVTNSIITSSWNNLCTSDPQHLSHNHSIFTFELWKSVNEYSRMSQYSGTLDQGFKSVKTSLVGGEKSNGVG